MLDKVEDALESCNIRYERLDGTMKRDDRVKAMDTLKYDPGCEVLLVSLRAGGVGLNLTAASRVYLMDPYWCAFNVVLSRATAYMMSFRNPAVENQAVDRIVRRIHTLDKRNSLILSAAAPTRPNPSGHDNQAGNRKHDRGQAAWRAEAEDGASGPDAWSEPQQGAEHGTPNGGAQAALRLVYALIMYSVDLLPLHLPPSGTLCAPFIVLYTSSSNGWGFAQFVVVIFTNNT
jgi:hypothetical protein